MLTCIIFRTPHQLNQAQHHPTIRAQGPQKRLHPANPLSTLKLSQHPLKHSRRNLLPLNQLPHPQPQRQPQQTPPPRKAMAGMKAATIFPRTNNKAAKQAPHQSGIPPLRMSMTPATALSLFPSAKPWMPTQLTRICYRLLRLRNLPSRKKNW